MDDGQEFALDAELYGPVSPDAPAGPDLSGDDDWHALKAACAAKPERYDPIAGKELPAEPPNWAQARPLIRAFLTRSKDLRALVLLAQAELAVGGVAGLAGALHLMRATLTEFWDEAHPRADEDGDFWERAAAIRALGAAAALARPIERAVIHQSKAVGPLTWRSLSIAAGESKPRDGEIALGEDSLRQLIAEEKGAAEAFRRAHAAAGAAAGLLGDIERIVSEAEGSERISLSEPMASLRKLESALAPLSAEPPEAGDAGGGDEEAAAEDAEAEAPERRAAPKPAPGEIGSRDEAIELMNEIVAYYARSARSSPVPFIVIRVRDLLDKSFHQVLEDVAPGSWDEAALRLANMGPELLGPAPERDAGAGVAPDAVTAAAARIEEALDALAATLAAPAPADAADEADPPADPPPETAPDPTEALAALRAAVADLKALAAPPEEQAEDEGAARRIRDRGEVKEALDRLARFFERADPNSLAPIFLRRARPLVDQSFLDILREIAPSGASTAKLLLHRG